MHGSATIVDERSMIEYAAALLLTLAIEVPIVTGGLARWYRVPFSRGLSIAAGASLVTHPVVWFVLPGLLVPVGGSLGYLLVAEAFAWLTEAGVFWLTTRRDPVGLLLLSLVANLASFGFGSLLWVVGLW
jgi:hypothetical protein